MDRFKQMLLESGALVEGHFVYQSGRHGRQYVNKTAALVPSTHAQAFASKIRSWAVIEANLWPEVVVGPELGAITLMTRVADDLSNQGLGREVYGVVATKVSGTDPIEFMIARDQARFVNGKRVLIIEDVVTSGGSIAATARAVEAAGGVVVAGAALWNRGGVSSQKAGVPLLFAVVDEPLEDFAPEDCPLCAAGVPVNTDLGKGKQFLESRRASA